MPVGYPGIFGLGGFIYLVLSLLNRSVDLGFVFGISALYPAALFGLCFLLLRQMAGSGDAVQGAPEISAAKRGAPQFRSGITAQLAEPAEPPVSVTENTTGTFDKVLAERKG